MQVVRPDLDTGDNFIIAGPLNLNRRMMRADTIMGERLQLSPSQFRTLLMLVSNEGVSVPFEELHMFMTMPDEEKCSIHTAKDVISTLVNIVNISGRGFAKIEVFPNDEYVFVTKWGMDWRSSEDTISSEPNINKGLAAIDVGDRFSKIALSVATIAALLVFIGSYFMFQTNDDNLVYIPAAQIPLSAMPDFNQSISFPYINGSTFYVDESNGIYVNTYNFYNGNVVFMLCLYLADSHSPLSRSLLVPRGEVTNTINLFESLESGKHSAEFTLRAYCTRLLIEIDQMRVQIVINIE